MFSYVLMMQTFMFCIVFHDANCDGSEINLKYSYFKRQNHLIRAQSVADIREWSMVVGVIEETWPKVFTCSGVLVSDRHVLTAAHCLTNIYRNGCREPILSNFKVKIGFTNLNDQDIVNQRETFRVIAYSIPDGFNGCSFDLAMKSGRDIALITLDRQIPQTFFDNKFASKVRLPTTSDTDLAANIPLKIAGYGKDETGVYGFLRNSTTYLLNKETCEVERQHMQSLLDKNYITNLPWDSMCTTDHSILCDGDSGSPLMVEDPNGIYKLIAIAIQTAGCTVNRVKGGSGDVYTKVDLYQNWINPLIL